MRTGAERVLVLLMVIAITVGCRVVADKATVNAWIEDIEYLRTELPRRHPVPFMMVSEQEWDAMLDDLRADLPYLAEDQVRLRIKQAVATLGDAHTTVPILAVFPDWDQIVFPLEFAWFEDGLRVVAASDDLHNALGKRVVGVGGQSLGVVVDTIGEVISHENKYWVRSSVPSVLASPDMMVSLGLVEGDSLRLQLADAGDRIHEINVYPRKAADITWEEVLTEESKEDMLWLKSDLPYWYEYIPEHKLLYFQFNRSRDVPYFKEHSPAIYESLGVKSFSQLRSGLLEAVHTSDVNSFVIDLRRNTGGDSEVGSYFFTHLLPDIQEINQKGRLFVIVGKDTFSAGVLNAIRIRVSTEALLFGEPTGGGPNMYGNLRSFELPNSGMTVQCATQRFSYGYHYGLKCEEENTLIPDFIVHPVFEDYVQGKDTVMEAIISYSETR